MLADQPLMRARSIRKLPTSSPASILRKRLGVIERQERAMFSTQKKAAHPGGAPPLQVRELFAFLLRALRVAEHGITLNSQTGLYARDMLLARRLDMSSGLA